MLENKELTKLDMISKPILQFGPEDYNIRLLGIDSHSWEGKEHFCYIYDLITAGKAFTLHKVWKISCN